MGVTHQVKLLVLLVVGVAVQAERKVVIILGAPCAGCGTQSPNIVDGLGIPHLDTGNMLRQAALSGTAAGKIAHKMMDEGVLVTDDIVQRIVADRIAEPDCSKGFLLDGFPRNVEQSRFLDKVLAKSGDTVSDVLMLNVPEKALQQCVMQRWMSDSGDEWTSGYKAFRVPKSLPAGAKAMCDPNDLKHCNMWDDETGEPLIRRSDDNLKTLAQRLVIFHEQTLPILDHYTSVVRNVNGHQTEPQVWSDIKKELGIPASAVGFDQPTESLALAARRQQAVPTPATLAGLVASGVCAIAVAVITRPRNSDMSESLLVE